MHLYAANPQPATRFRDSIGNRPFWRRNPPGRQIFADCCGRQRPAKNLVVQVYFDGLKYFCADGKGCKAK